METISKQLLYRTTEDAFGTVPGLIKELGEYSLATAYLYSSGVQIMSQGTFTEVETNAIDLKISMLNKCNSCIRGHSYLLKRAGMADDQIHAILTGQSVSSTRLSALLRATEYIYHAGSDVFPELVINFFADHEISTQEVIEIIGLIAIKTISNYTNNYLMSIKQLSTK
jgi:AhpD family alkylhydroperoxidase